MDFPGNSHKAGEGPLKPKEVVPPKNVQKVVSGEVIQRKKPLGRRLKETLFKSAGRYVVRDVLVPAFKNMFVDAVNEGAKRTVYGESQARNRDFGRSRFSYNSPVDRYPQARPRTFMLPDQAPHYEARRRQDTMEIILSTREEAEVVLERLSDLIDKYDVASVADLRDLLGQPSTHIDNKWGWAQLKFSDIRQIREGYLLDLPPVEPI
jgi:hypothetical protein